jgi:hypothetical protein
MSWSSVTHSPPNSRANSRGLLSLTTAYCLLLSVFSVPARGTQVGPYQPSIVEIDVTAFFS